MLQAGTVAFKIGEHGLEGASADKGGAGSSQEDWEETVRHLRWQLLHGEAESTDSVLGGLSSESASSTMRSGGSSGLLG